MKRPCLFLCLFLALSGTCAAAPEGYRAVESVAASVNGEVIFLSDVAREACYYRCGTVPGQAPQELSLSQAREKLIADTLVIQEAEKLGLGVVDNAAISSSAAESLSLTGKCAHACAEGVTEAQVRDLVRRRLLVRDFLEKRIAVFIEVNEEEVRRETGQRSHAGAPPAELSEEAVRKSLYAEKAATEIRNWFSRSTSRSRIVLSPLSEP